MSNVCVLDQLKIKIVHGPCDVRLKILIGHSCTI